MKVPVERLRELEMQAFERAAVHRAESFVLRGGFIVGPDEVKHLGSIVEQRLAAQNDYDATGEEFTLHYERGRSYTVPSLSEVATTDERENSTPSHVSIRWSYDVSVPNATSPKPLVIFLEIGCKNERGQGRVFPDLRHLHQGTAGESFIAVGVIHEIPSLSDEILRLLRPAVSEWVKKTRTPNILLRLAQPSFVLGAVLIGASVPAMLLSFAANAILAGEGPDQILRSGYFIGILSLSSILTLAGAIFAGAIASAAVFGDGIGQPVGRFVLDEVSRSKRKERLERQLGGNKATAKFLLGTFATVTLGIISSLIATGAFPSVAAWLQAVLSE